MKKATHNYQEVFDASLNYFQGDEFAAKLFPDKYALTPEDGVFEELTPDDMHWRLAREFHRIELKYPNAMSEKDIYGLLKDFRYVVPQGSPMAGIGNPYQIMSISNCFVLNSPLDSYAGIMQTDQEQAHIMRRRGGVGFDLSNIRPKGLPTKNAAKTTDGIGIFMERYSSTCREVAQNGRRGALMLTISIHHPEVLTFIKIKQDRKKVTGANVSVRVSDEFMQAVKDDTEYEQRWPVEGPKVMSNRVNAREVWNELIQAAHTSAEPGILFWTTAETYSPADIYRDFGFRSTATNPCFSGETLIAVADGRNYVSIKQLAEEGMDVPVYSVDPLNGKVSIKMGRNPRITGYSHKLVRVHLDDGSYLDTTPNHKFITLDGKQIEANKLVPGTSLPRFNKFEASVKKGSKPYYRVSCDTKNFRKDQIFEHRLIAQFNNPEQWQSMYDEAKKNGWTTGGIVVHHKNYNQLDNSPDNLQIMTFKDHAKLHGEIDQAGEKNGRWMDVSNDQIKKSAIELTKKLNRRFSGNEWLVHAKENNLPQTFSNHRATELGSPLALAFACAVELGIENAGIDPRLVRTYHTALAQNYVARIDGNEVLVHKNCENCSGMFETEYHKREVAFCSHKCVLKKINSNTEMHKTRVAKTSVTYAERSVQLKQNQAKVWSDLKFTLGHEPMLKEWEQACKNTGQSFRLKTKFGFKNTDELREAGNNYNHKVVRVEELSGDHTVYNITVDDNHTVAIVTDVEQKKQTGIYVAQCGEIILSPDDSCRLLLVNLMGFVKHPFTSKAKFDYKHYGEVVVQAQRLMDDVIDLETECVDRILAKIHADPEPASVKRLEVELWERIKKACLTGRRTGLGITALGDALAALGIKYGSEESIRATGEIYKHLAVNAYRSTCIMAGERGAFPIFDHKLEEGHPFLQRIWDADPEVYELYKKHGRRNIALTTTAPAGSVSTLTRTTSGIEPAYLLSYVRRKKINPNDKNARTDFIDPMGDHWQEFTIYHPCYKQWMDVTGETDVTKSPYFGATSNDIDWVASAKLQGAAQKWICHSISKTCNLPADTTVETVKDVYMMAWEQGCKGFTVYRDGCRTGVLVSEEAQKQMKARDPMARPENVEVMMAPKRPAELSCDIKKAKVQGEGWTIFVGMLNNKPYEVFGGLSKYVDIPNKYKHGRIIKNGKVEGVTSYNLIVGEDDDEMVIKNIASVFENANYGAFTRTISLALRHGCPPQFVMEQLQKDKFSDMTSFSKVMGRVLKSYISDGTKSASDKKCASCGQDGIVYVEGCLKCVQCGFSKCG